MDTHTKSGRTTAYGFACGYCERKVLAGGRYASAFDQDRAEIYMEHNTYHVRRFTNGSRVLWETFETLKPARKLFDSLKA